MQAILEGAGDSFILGCNHPIWPSFGLIHGSRSSGDIKRTWKTFAGTARMNLSRNWQNGRLWWNDPDCVVLTGDLADDEYLFHATAIYATAAILLPGAGGLARPGRPGAPGYGIIGPIGLDSDSYSTPIYQED